MSELDSESGTTETLEQALARNWSGETPEAEAAPDLAEDTVPADEPEGIQAESEVQDSDEDSLEPLEKWNDETKAFFETLPREQQETLIERWKDADRYLNERTQALSETQKRYEKLDPVLEQYFDLAKKSGVELAPIVGNAMQYYAAFQRDPKGTLKVLAQAAGVDLAGLEYEQQEVDPSIRAQSDELRQLRNEIAELKSQSTQSAESQIEGFRTAQNDDGSLKYPHFEELRTVMAPIVQSGKSLEDAYKEAQWSLPQYRQEQLEAERKQALKDAEASRAKKAQKARNSQTLPASDVDVSTSLPAMNGRWEAAIQHSLSKLTE